MEFPPMGHVLNEWEYLRRNGLDQESSAEKFIECYFLSHRVREGWKYQKQYKIPDSRKKIDYLVTTEEGISFGIECKAKMIMGLDGVKARVLANHFEQAAAYAQSLKLPVFIGPVWFDSSPSGAGSGGQVLTALSALNLFGGRMNVGTLLWHDYGYSNYWSLSLRGKSFWLHQTGFVKAMTKLVTTEGSKKERKDLST
tara:strand:- start:2197 stop:2790 length:594 start_codon:yes stop_codon:yes gene_type:complete